MDERMIKTTEKETRRSQFEIIAEMLGVARGGELKTRIMYGANLSNDQLNYYFPLILKAGLLKIVKDDNLIKKDMYDITDRGRKFIETYLKIESLLKP